MRNAEPDLPESIRIKIDINSFDEIIFSPSRTDDFKNEVAAAANAAAITIPLVESKINL